MSTIDALYKQLLNAADSPLSDTYAENLENILTEIGSFKDPTSIGVLVGFFDDEAAYDELMFSIIHLIESFDDDTYITEILDASTDLHRQSPRWASIVFMRILNSHPARGKLVRQLGMASTETKQTIREIVELINARNNNFREKATPVLEATLL